MAASNISRQSNQDALHSEKDIGLEELDGFQLPSDVTAEFLTRMQKESDLLDMVDTVTLDRLEQEVPKFGVPRLSGGLRDEEGSRTEASDVQSGAVKFNVTDQNYYILVEPKRDALKNTHQGVQDMGNMIIDEFVSRWANDLSIIGIRANAGEGNLDDLAGRDDIDDRFNGWIAIAEGSDEDSDRIALEDTGDGDETTMPEVDMAGEPVDTEMFNDAIVGMDSRYRDPDETVFLMGTDQVQQYHFDLTQREDSLGVPILQGDNDVTPFDYDVIGVPEWPNEYAMFTNPENLAFGLYEEMELDQTTDTDKVHEERLHSRNWLEGQFDFQIKELQGGVLISGLNNATGA